MWLSGQQKRPAETGESRTGTVTMEGGELGVLLESERRGLEIYGPAGYQWTPRVGQQVLVLKGRGDIPCVVGVRQNGDVPGEIALQADRVELKGQVLINGEPLEDYVRRVAAATEG